MTEKGNPRIFYGYIVVAAAFFVTTIAWGANWTFGVFIVPMLAEFGWTRAGIAAPFTLSTILGGLLGIIAGRLSDRFGPRIVVTVCGLFIGSSYLLMSQIRTLWHLYLFLGVVLAIGMSCSWAPLLSIAPRWFVKRRGLMSGIIASGPALGMSTLPLFASWFISGYGWRASYILLGSFVLLLILIPAQFLKRDPSQMELLQYGVAEAKAGSSVSPVKGLSLKKALRSRQFWILAGIFISGYFTANVVMVHLVIYAIGVGIPSITAAAILSATAGISLPGRIIAGGVADRIGSKQTLIIGFSLTLLAFLFLLPGKETWILWLFAVIFGLGGWVFAPMMPVITADLFGTVSHGEVFAAAWSIASIGSAFGPSLAGYVFDLTESYQLVFLGCAALSVGAMTLTLFLKLSDSRKRHQVND